MRIILNPDSNKVKEIKEVVQKNDGYCPCAVVKCEDTKCMCKAFREQTEPGECHCGLYVKVGEEK